MPDDDALIQSYLRTKSVWKTGAELGMAGQSVHKRLQQLGYNKPMRVFTAGERDILQREYRKHAESGTLELLAKRLGRTKQYVCRQARHLGLTGLAPKRPWIATWKYMEEPEARRIFEKFKRVKRGSVDLWCKKQGYDDLGFSRTMQRFFPDEWDALMELRQPKTSRYKRGRQFEYRARDELRARGFFVLRSPASRSPVDLVAIRTGKVLFVQCKLSGQFNKVTEWNEFYKLAKSVGAIPILCSRSNASGGIRYERMMGTKDRSRKRQPREPFDP